MRERARRLSTILLWSLGLAVAIAAARYFLDPPPFLRPPRFTWMPQGPEADVAANVAAYLFENHRWLFRLHIGCGIAAMCLGLFQFIASLRHARPAVHRFLGLGYVMAVIVGGMSGLPLSFYLLDAVPDWMRSDVYLASAGFATLAVVWPAVTTMAFVRARQRRYDSHRAWMIRSYCLTFAAVTVRLVAGPLILISQNVIFTVSASIWSWVLNALFAEWLIRRKDKTLIEPAAEPFDPSRQPG
jgi:hypothetical protein